MFFEVVFGLLLIYSILLTRRLWVTESRFAEYRRHERLRTSGDNYDRAFEKAGQTEKKNK